MLAQNEADLELLLKLIGSDVLDPIAELREIRLQRLAEHEARVHDMAANTEYRFQRIERVPAYSPNGEPMGMTERGVELLVLKYRDFDKWAKQAGIKADTLQAVAESREKQFKDKRGNIWRAYPSLYRDNRPSQADIDEREQDIREDREFAAKQASKQRKE
jgi:hypothetical protein